MNEQAELLGRDHPVLGDIAVKTLCEGRLALGLSAGLKPKPNEDAAAAAVMGDDVVLALADGHWGREASHLSVTLAVEMLTAKRRPLEGAEMRARLCALFEQINRRLLEDALETPGSPASETTLIVCHVQGLSGPRYVTWASFGDSYLLHQSGSKTKQINTLRSWWLGALSKLSERAGPPGLRPGGDTSPIQGYAGVAAGIEQAEDVLLPGDLLLLASDGLLEPSGPSSRLSGREIRALMGGAAGAQAKVRTLIEAALRKGGQDNVCCVLLEMP